MTLPEDGLPGRLDRSRAALLAGVMALAVLLRLPDLFGWWLNPDEGIYYAAVTRDRFGDLWTEALATAHPPLYFVILRAASWLSTDFLALRGVAFVSGCAAVWAFVLVGREVGGEGARGTLTGLLAGLLLAVSPMAVAQSQLIRPYSTLVLLLAGALFFTLRYLRRPSPGALAGYLACAVSALLLHYSAVLALGAIGVLVLGRGATAGGRTTAWWRILAAQAVPSAVLVALYFWHLRGLSESSMADFALEGWLSPYMIDTPGDAWTALVGACSGIAGARLALPGALLTLAALARAARTASWTPLLVVGGGCLMATVGAAANQYPFGATRHTIWLFVFLIPGLAWLAAGTLTAPPRVRAAALAGLAACWLAADPLASLLRADGWEAPFPERVVASGHMDAMRSELDPEIGPRLVVMGVETYQMLSPLYEAEREAARSSASGVVTLPWGVHDIVVAPGLDFRAAPDVQEWPSHLLATLDAAVSELGVSPPDDTVLVVAGGWRFQGVNDLIELASSAGSLGTTTSVPGLIALRLDFDAYERALR